MARTHSKRGEGRGGPAPEGSSGLVSLVAALLVWGATAAAVGGGVWWLERDVKRAAAGQPLRLEWAHLPDWMQRTPWLRERVESAIPLYPEDNIYQPEDLCARVGESLAASPWVAEVQRVSKHADGRLVVQARFREPAAFVIAGERAYVVDSTGVRLPLDYPAEEPGLPPWQRIVGVAQGRPDVGETWAGADLAAGMKLVSFLHEAARHDSLSFSSSLRAVDVGNFGFRSPEHVGDGQLRIRTVYPGCYIDWGEPPGEEGQIDPDAHHKLWMLNKLYKEQGRLPDQILSVRNPRGIEQREPRRR